MIPFPQISQLCTLNKTVALFLLLCNFGFASSLVGYQNWAGANPKIEVQVNESVVPPLDVKIVVRCEGASAFKVSNDPSFRGATWREFVPSLYWMLNPKDTISTIYFVFKKKTEKGTFVTEIETYSFDRYNLSRKIDRVGDSGYVDWTAGNIHIDVFSTYPLQGGERYSTDKAQQIAETKLYETAFKLIQKIQVDYFFRVKDILALNPILRNDMNRYLSQIKVTDIKYHSRESVELNAILSFSFGKNPKHLNISFLSLPLQNDYESVSNVYSSQFDSLLLDLRGSFFKPCLFPQVISEDGKPLVSVSRFVSKDAVYARYIRSLSKQISQQMGKALIVKAYNVSSGDKSKIMLSKRYESLLTGNETTLSNICNGNFYILTE